MPPFSQDDKSHPPKKRIIEFDMFVRDLEPENDEKVTGGKGETKHPAKRSSGEDAES